MPPVALLAAALFFSAGPAQAEIPDAAFALPASRPRSFESIPASSLSETRPLGRFTVGLYGEGRAHARYGAASGGASGTYRGHEKVNVLFNAAAHHLQSGDPRPNPLDENEPAAKRHYLLRLSAGLEFLLPYHLSLETWAGVDAAGGRSGVIEGGLSWWPRAYTYHPLRLGLSVSHDDQTRTRLLSAGAEWGLGRWLGLNWCLTGSGRHYSGRFARRSRGTAGGGIGAGHPGRGWGFRLQAGGGAHGRFGEVALFHAFRP